jgi:hypothetical protein
MSSSNNQIPISEEKWVKLSEKTVKHIFYYYCFMFLFCTVFLYILLTSQSILSDESIKLSHILSLSFIGGMLGSTFYYIRKLYKCCIQLLVDTQETSIATIGTKMYFILRPIMGATLSAIVLIGIYGGVFFLIDQPDIYQSKFYIFTTVFSFITGFSNGNIIIKLDSSKDKIAELVDFSRRNNHGNQ